jgi:membrane-bound acyltransferase YfiQ involved in biofilm formation
LRDVLNWLLWWRVSDAEVESQVKNYDVLTMFQSARGLSMVFLLAAALVMSFVIFFGATDAIGYVDVGIFGILAVLIYEGYRWAMLAAMIAWTIEKLLSVLSPSSVMMVIVAVVWWTVYMRVFYLALRTERRRAALTVAP